MENKRIVAFTCGRRGGNTEIYVKAALKAAARMGIACELIRLNECDLGACKDCLRGPCYAKGPGACILKDDGDWLAQKFLESDGYLLAAPVWSLSPAGIVTVFRDRIFGPKMDLAAWEMNGGAPEWAHGRKLQRPGALISVGGALTEHWTSLGLATLYTTTFSAQTNVVDHLNIFQVADQGEALMRRDYLKKAEYLGQNLGHAVLNPQIDWTHRFLGEEKHEACPGCHTSVVIAKPGRDFVECAICGRKGFVSLVDGKLAYRWPDDPQDRLTMMGKYDHMREISRHTEERFKPHEAEIQEELKAWRAFEDFTVEPPSKVSKRAAKKAD